MTGVTERETAVIETYLQQLFETYGGADCVTVHCSRFTGGAWYGAVKGEANMIGVDVFMECCEDDALHMLLQEVYSGLTREFVGRRIRDDDHPPIIIVGRFVVRSLNLTNLHSSPLQITTKKKFAIERWVEPALERWETLRKSLVQ